MADQRNISFEIDPKTWVHAPPPPPLTAAAASRSVNFDLDAALLHVGIVTRPPELHGFTLSDSWAWLRYFPAFAAGPNLRLRPEWTRIDSHQKTVASDDFGVGIGTWVLRDLLGFRRYADTLYVVNVLERGQWLLRRHAKRGPTKSPDYLAYTDTGEVSVVECKGTQSSYAELVKALVRGSPQKRALRAVGAQQLIHQLVVGAYVPQHEGSGNAILAVHDPEKNDARQELRKYTEEEIVQSTEQVSIAKELALFDMSSTAATLIHDRYSSDSLGLALLQDIVQSREAGRVTKEDVVLVERDYRWVVPVVRPDHTFRGVRFRGRLPLDNIERFRRVRNQRDLPDSIVADTREEDWKQLRTDRGVMLESPLGAIYEVEWLE